VFLPLNPRSATYYHKPSVMVLTANLAFA